VRNARAETSCNDIIVFMTNLIYFATRGIADFGRAARWRGRCTRTRLADFFART
jgi:hypothetical protein